MGRLVLISSLLILACGGPGDGGSGGGGTSGSGGGTGGGTSGNGGGTSGTGGGTGGTGGGTSGTGGGTHSTGGGTSGTGGGTHSTGGGSSGTGGGSSGTGGGSSFSGIKKVFVIAMENQGTNAVYSSTNATYLNNTLMTSGSYATMFGDVLASSTPSEPHYVWMEAGTNTFADHTFTTDSDPSASNSTSSTAHLATQLTAAGKTWRAYQEDLDSSATGLCPVASGNGLSNQFAAKHDPFVFFQDVAGSPPSKTNTSCATHHRVYTKSSLATDLTNNDVADYTFITPNLCNDMHGGVCGNGCSVLSPGTCVSKGDAWLADNVPQILTYINAHDGVLFVIWDEPDSSSMVQPFVVVGPHVKNGYASGVSYNLSSYLKSLEEIFRVPVLSNVQSANDFADFFQPGYFP